MAAVRRFIYIVIFDTFLHIKAHDPPQPSLTVSPTAIREKDSVQLICETPPSASGSQCYFTFKFVEFPLSTDCQQTLTGNDLVKWTGQSSPAVVKMQCQYSVTNWKYRSIYSEPSTVTIQDDPQLTVSPTVITERDSVQLICETPPSLPVSHCYFNMGGSSLPDSSCKQSVTGTQLLTWAGQPLPALVQVKCYYTVFGRTRTSPFSNQVSVTIQVGSTVSSHPDPITTDKPTTSSTSPSTSTTSATKSDFSLSSTLTTTTPQKSSKGSQSSTESSRNLSDHYIKLVKLIWLAAVGVASAVGVFLVGLTAVCFYRKTRRKYALRTQTQQDDHNQRPAEENRQSPGNGNSDTYHVYSSIPDRAATSGQTEASYSLLQTKRLPVTYDSNARKGISAVNVLLMKRTADGLGEADRTQPTTQPRRSFTGR
ncbi:hypothetical protein DPEC_G00194420 [Dallia pectoralis]|uniref:Uncharacterized protein n=1 Tax=Dallia pectoralis TaxID=75939 RepID=A0ACC2G7B0_DALPE|nr:hypothetical protein DPEC_G00194420 [Dallia pectoralis]